MIWQETSVTRPLNYTSNQALKTQDIVGIQIPPDSPTVYDAQSRFIMGGAANYWQTIFIWRLASKRPDGVGGYSVPNLTYTIFVYTFEEFW